MTSRERLIAALQHKEPDRIPLDLGGLPTTIETIPYEDLKRHLGLQKETKRFVRDHVDPDPEVLDRFGIDTRYIRGKAPSKNTTKILNEYSYIDEWGITWSKPPSSLYFDPVAHPLHAATLDDLQKFDWPDPLDEGRTKGVKEEAEHMHKTTDFALVGDLSGVGIFETAWLMRGLSHFMEDLLIEKEFAHALLRKVTELKKLLYGRFLDQVGEYLQVIMVSDDLGMENNLLISPEVYREMIKPYHKELWSSIKEKTDAFLFLHSCGSIHKLIPDLIELGVNIINPVQVAAKDMDSALLKREFGDRISFWGGIDTQHVMPNGTPEDVEEEVRHRLHDLAPGGGYVLCAVHNIQPGVPPENVVTMYDAAQKFGEYPIEV